MDSRGHWCKTASRAIPGDATHNMNTTLKKALIGFATMAIAYAAAVLLVHGPADTDTTILRVVIGVVMGLFYVVYFIPPVTNLVERHAQAVKWTGIAVTVAGIAAPIMMGVLGDGGPPSDSVTATGTGVAMIGFLLAFIPGRLPELRRAQAAQRDKKLKKEQSAGFDPISSGWSATGFVYSNFAVFLRLCGSWVVLIIAGTAVSLYVAVWIAAGELVPLDQVRAKIDAVVLVLGLLLPFQVLLAIGVPAALVAWHRFVAGEAHRGIALPGRAALRYLWRLWIVSFAFGAISRLPMTNAANLAAFLGTSHVAAVGYALFALLLLLAIVTGSMFALVLPAIALGRRDFKGGDSIRLVLRFRFRFAFGFIIALLPFTALAVGCIWLLLNAATTTAIFGAAFGAAVLGMMALASGATYLSRAYAMLTPASETAP